MGEVYQLDERQQRQVAKMLGGDNRARFIEMPDYPDTQVKVLQGDGQKIGEITMAQAFRLN